MRIGIVGSFSGTHVGGSFARAATKLGHTVRLFDIAKAHSGSRLARAARWRLEDRKPAKLEVFSGEVTNSCRTEPIDILIVTGLAPLTATAIDSIRLSGTRVVNFLTDDPWNKAQGSKWQFQALPRYDAIFSPRSANLEDLRRLGCPNVHYLPFAYDEDLFGGPPPPWEGETPDVLFVGGADRDRRQFVRSYIHAGGPPLTLAGAYWRSCDAPRSAYLGKLKPSAMAAVTNAARINLCLVRRANRDDHVMRSFEIAALGCCALVEKTSGHREIFGDSARYFNDPHEAAVEAKRLLVDPQMRADLQAATRARLATGGNTYLDRLLAIVS